MSAVRAVSMLVAEVVWSQVCGCCVFRVKEKQVRHTHTHSLTHTHDKNNTTNN